MLITQLVDSLTNKAVLSALTPSSVICYDKNVLRVFLGFTNSRESVEYAKEVELLLSTPIPKKAEIREIIVSKSGDYTVLIGARTVHVVRIGAEILVGKPDRLPTQCFCECYPLHDSFLLQNSALSVVQARILSQKCDEQTICAVLYSDSCIRFYNIHRKHDSLLLTIDFRHLLHQNYDSNNANNTFGLQKALVSFDLIPPLPKASHFSLIVVDSDVEFYGSFVYFSCFKEGISPRIHRLETVDGLPCDPLNLQCLEVSNPKVSSVFVLVSGGGVVSHLVVFPNEFGEFQLLVHDQLRLPSSAGDPRIAPNQIKKLNRNRYEISTATCLFSVNISPWFDNLIGAGQTTNSLETRVSELVNVVDSSAEFVGNKSSATWTGAKALRAISIQLMRENDEEMDDLAMDDDEILHLVILETKDGEAAHVFTVSTFENSSYPSGTHPTTSTSFPTSTLPPISKNTIEQQLADLKPIPACFITDKITEEEAIEAALKYIEIVEERMRKHEELAKSAVERCTMLAASAQVLDEKQQMVDERLVEETTAVESLKEQMHDLKTRMDATRKSMNVLFHRVEENVPLSDNEIRIYERLKEHQKMLSDMSINVPKMSLDSNELHRIADQLSKKRIGEEPNKFGQVERNATDIQNLENRESKLSSGIVDFSA